MYAMYPTPLKKVGLNNLDEFKSKFSVNVGLSDHSESIWPSILAISKMFQLLRFISLYIKMLLGQIRLHR